MRAQKQTSCLLLASTALSLSCAQRGCGCALRDRPMVCLSASHCAAFHLASHHIGPPQIPRAPPALHQDATASAHAAAAAVSQLMHAVSGAPSVSAAPPTWKQDNANLRSNLLNLQQRTQPHASGQQQGQQHKVQLPPKTQGVGGHTQSAATFYNKPVNGRDQFINELNLGQKQGQGAGAGAGVGPGSSAASGQAQGSLKQASIPGATGFTVSRYAQAAAAAGAQASAPKTQGPSVFARTGGIGRGRAGQGQGAGAPGAAAGPAAGSGPAAGAGTGRGSKGSQQLTSPGRKMVRAHVRSTYVNRTVQRLHSSYPRDTGPWPSFYCTLSY